MELSYIFILVYSFLVKVQTTTICVSNVHLDESLNCSEVHIFNSEIRKLENHTVIKFMNTAYTMNFTWHIDNLTNITITTAPSIPNAIITCTNPRQSGIVFDHINNLTLTNLNFDQCGSIIDLADMLHAVTSLVSPALLFYRGSNLTMGNVTITNATFTGFCISNVIGNVQLKQVKVTETHFAGSSLQSGSIVLYSTDSKYRTCVNITGSNFTNNGGRYIPKGYSFTSGLVLLLNTSLHLTISIVNTTFHHNIGHKGGHLAIFLHDKQIYLKTPIITLDRVCFRNGKAFQGGGIYIRIAPSGNVYQVSRNATQILINNCSIINNTAVEKSGGILLEWKASLGFQGHINVYLNKSKFAGNSLTGGPGGLALQLYNYVLSLDDPNLHNRFQVNVFLESCYFYYHKPLPMFEPKSGVIYGESMLFIYMSKVEIKFNDCRAILAVNSLLLFHGKSVISYNWATSGAGIQLCSNSFMYFAPYTNLLIANNKADTTGGGISVDSKCFIDETLCFYQYSHHIQINQSLMNSVDFVVRNNTAIYAGDNIYGGSIEHCYFLHSNKTKIWINTPNNTKSPSSISSSPQDVCILKNDSDTHCKNITHISVYPGRKHCFFFRVVGQLQGAVPGVVTASTKDTDVSLNPSQVVQDITKKKGRGVCYDFYSNNLNVSKSNYITLHVVNNLEPESYSFSKKTGIHVNFMGCPSAYTIQKIIIFKGSKVPHYGCKCNKTYFAHLTRCAHEDEFPNFIKKKYSWIGVVNQTNNKTYYASSSYCPPDQCNATLTVVNLTHPNEQCLYNRTGIMCGSCPTGLSLQFGSSKCVQGCSYTHLLLVVPFALIGLLLVLLIGCLNLTVTTGTVNGVIFYANILQDNYVDTILTNHYVPVLSTILSTYLAWVNLDVGIPMCFYREMGAIGKTLVPGIFPLYLWAIALTIVVLSNKNVFITHLLGNNAVKVLATLVLLSYSKILRVTVGLFSFINVRHFSSYTGKVEYRQKWVFNGDLDFQFPNINVMTLVAASIFMAILFPFTLSLLFVTHTSKISNYCKRISFIDKMKPFFDAYTGTMKDNARFWPGLLLLCRILILLVKAIFPKDLFRVHYTTLLVCISLSMTMVKMNGVYTLSHLNTLEYTFIVNILVLLTSLTCLNTSDSNYSFRKWITFLLISLSFFVTMGILLYHVYLKISQSKWMQKVFRKRNKTISLENSESFEGRRGYTQIDSDSEEINDSSYMTEFSTKATNSSLKTINDY